MRRASSAEEICAAYLAAPLRAPQQALPWETCNAQAVLRILRLNKVPLLGLHETDPSRPLLDDPLFQTARQVEAAQLASLRAEYKPVKEALASTGVADVLVKSVGLAPSFPYKSDNLDVLYRPEDVEQVRATLLALSYVELRNVEEPHKYLFRKFHAGRSVSAIHVHAHVGWMVSFLDEEALWKRCGPAPDDPLVSVPAPEDALLTTLAHLFYEDKRVVLQDLSRLEHCLRCGVQWDEVYRIAAWRGWEDGLYAALLLCAYQERVLYGASLFPPDVLQRAARECPRWARADVDGAQRQGAREASLRIPFAFSKAFFYRKLLRDPSRNAAQRAKDLLLHTGYGIKLRLHIHSQPRMLVTFSGVDGSGKTTQVEALQSAFQTCHLCVQRVWSRGGSAPWIGWLTGRRPVGPQYGGTFGLHAPRSQSERSPRTTGLRDAPSARAAEDKVRARQIRFRSPWLRWGWSWLTTIELLWEYAHSVTLPLWLGRVVIADRYVFDALADWAAYFHEESVEKRWAARLLRRLSPRPAMAFLLDLSPAEAQSRSSDGLPAEFLGTQAAAYQRLASLFGLQRLNAARGRDELADEIVPQVLRHYFANYHTLLNALFLKNPGQWR